jgi:hypothetical protein
LLVLSVLNANFAAPARAALTPDSPEVQRLIAKGMAYLEVNNDNRLGGMCLLGLCHLKHTGDKQHADVVKAIEACQRVCRAEPAAISVDIYSTGIAIFFLCEVDAEKHNTAIEKLVQSLILRQKNGGGFGYPAEHNHGTTGDTSMTQYAVLGLWAAKQHGIAVPQEVSEKVCNWLIRTQDPSGGWGYQGTDPNSYQRVKQTQIRPSLAAAGLGSAYICAHTLGLAAEAEDRRIEVCRRRFSASPRNRRPTRGRSSPKSSRAVCGRRRSTATAGSARTSVTRTCRGSITTCMRWSAA